MVKLIFLVFLTLFCMKEDIKKEETQKTVRLETKKKFRMECFIKAAGWEFDTLSSIAYLSDHSTPAPVEFYEFRGSYVGSINELSAYYWNPEKLQEKGEFGKEVYRRLPHKGKKKESILKIDDHVISVNDCFVKDMIDVFIGGMHTIPLRDEGYISLFDYVLLNDEKDVRKKIKSVTLFREDKLITIKF